MGSDTILLISSQIIAVLCYDIRGKTDSNIQCRVLSGGMHKKGCVLMKKRVLAYLKHVDELLADPPENADWEAIIREHLTQIGFFAHERLVHLIVTITFALMTTLVLLGLVVSDNLMLIALMVALMVLLFPYINHYYLLENSVQKMYTQYDKMQQFRSTGCLSNFMDR